MSKNISFVTHCAETMPFSWTCPAGYASQPGLVLARTHTIKPQNMFANCESRWTPGEREKGHSRGEPERERAAGHKGGDEQRSLQDLNPNRLRTESGQMGRREWHSQFEWDNMRLWELQLDHGSGGRGGGGGAAATDGGACWVLKEEQIAGGQQSKLEFRNARIRSTCK